MSTRRSRLQVKPNLGSRGPKTAGGRAGKTEDKPSHAAVLQDKGPPSTVKTPETSTIQDNSAQKSTVNESSGSARSKVSKTCLLSTEIQHTNPAETGIEEGQTAVPSVTETPSNLGGEIGSERVSEPVELQSGLSEQELTKIKDKPPYSGDKSASEGCGLTRTPLPLPSSSPKQSKTPVKPTPRLRSRFANRIKPNLTDAGKSRTRRSGSRAVETTDSSRLAESPVPAPVKSTEGQPDVTDGYLGEVYPGVTEQVPETPCTPGAILEETLSSPVHSGVGVPCEDRLGAEVEVAGGEVEAADKEVFTPPIPQTRPPRDLSPSSVADSDVSKDIEDVVETPPPTPKQKRKPPKVTAPVDKPPDKYKMLMKDLIYWNPIKNPMKVREKKAPIEVEKSPSEQPDEAPEEGAGEEGEEEELPVPQVKIGPDGSIILNEESLVIDKRADQSEVSDAGVVDETETLITYSSFRTRHLSKNWTEKETERFYYALSVVGTDFSMMSNLFKRRNRYDLKKKFKREEKYNRSQIDKALKERKKIDMSVFENVSDEDEANDPSKKTAGKKGRRSRSKGRPKGKGQGGGDENSDKEQKPGKKKSKPGKKKKTSPYFEEDTDESEGEQLVTTDNREPREPLGLQLPRVRVELEDDDEEDDEEFRTVAKKDHAASSDEDEMRVLHKMCQTTRSGRVPKRTSFYEVEGQGVATAKRPRKESNTGGKGGENSPRVSKSAASQTPLESNLANINETTQIQTVHNIPNVAGSQLLLVTQKGEDSQGQGTVIHVYMLSPSSHRSPEWPASPLTSPRTNPHVYSVSPRAPAEGGEVSVFPVTSPVGESSVTVISTEDMLPVVCAEETVATSVTESE